MKHLKFYFLIFFVLFCLVPKHNCHGVRNFIMDKIVQPIKSILPHRHNSATGAEESGSLDSYGRDIIRGTSKTITDLKNQVEATFSGDTKGLDCNKTLSGGKISSFKINLQAIYPGTKWCGDGNISKNYDDLGKYWATDSCCREHDLCPESIAAGSSKYDLKNTGLFTRSHCDCDQKFYECLKYADTRLSKSIGFTYFTILGPQCFKEDFPIVDCATEKSGKCVSYVTDNSSEKRYQWFDSPTY